MPFGIVVPHERLVIESVRQKDTIAIAGRIFDRLKAHFGRDNVFMDVDGNNQIVQGDSS